MGFESRYKLLEQKIVLANKSKSTLTNYSRRIASISLDFNALPEDLDDDQINDYLQGLASKAFSPSRSTFKHTVFGLRYYFKCIGLPKRSIALPSISIVSKLPVVLSREECRALFIAPKLLKHRVVLSLIYSAGLRVSELCNLKIGDVDFDRKLIHIKQSKYKKDRMVPLSEMIARGLKKYIDAEKPYIWLFNGKTYGEPMATRGILWIMKESIKKTSIQKESVCVHSLRHSYATHLLEDGVDIVTVQKLLGHANIATTMIYLHVCQPFSKKAHSPLDTLYVK